MTNKIYRGISKRNYSDKIIKHYETKRIPSNIPYLVDNLWEWLRPENMPTRRTAVYASPKKELAFEYATENDYVCNVTFEGLHSVVQIKDYSDAKFHPDVKSLPKLVLKHLGQEWIDSKLSCKLLLGRLFIPSLEKEEIESILSDDLFKELKEELINTSLFWKDTYMLEDGYEQTIGELFFYAKDGYYLNIED